MASGILTMLPGFAGLRRTFYLAQLDTRKMI